MGLDHVRKIVTVVEDVWVEGGRPVQPRTRIAAAGAVVDNRQCVPDGEINVALREGLIAEGDVAGEIGKVICGELEGRQSDEQITVFARPACASGLGYRAARVRARRRGRRGHREEDDFDVGGTVIRDGEDCLADHRPLAR